VAEGLFDAYVAGKAAAFFPGHYGSPDDRRRAVERAARPLAPVVADVLEAQNARLTPSPARAAHLAALRAGAAAVVTGQQMGLFLGPLFTIYKAASAVRAARVLSAESGREVVPVFWLQTEDHDLAEIAVCHLPCGDGLPRELRVPAAPANRVSVAHCRLPDDVSTCLAALDVELTRLPHAAAHLERLGRHYRPGRAWVDAFAGVLGDLFAPEGLVLIDPRHPDIAQVTHPLHRRALTDADGIAAALAARNRALEAAGFSPTVHVRAGAPLCFWHPDGPDGPRFRLTPAGGGFTLVGRDERYPCSALLAALDDTPLRFSTSVLLRPILQDTLLPTAAYVGGPAEVAYFAQLGPLYAAYDLAMPLVVPRARLRVIEGRTIRLLGRLGLAPDDASRPEAELVAAARTRTETADPGGLADKLLAPFTAALEKVQAEIEPHGSHLRIAVEKTRTRVETAVHKLVRKVEDVRGHADRETVAAVRRVKETLWPRDVPQERLYGLAYFAARYGERPFLERVLETVEPFDATPRDLVWTDEAVQT
jgi:bacillithiol biosynthesis cysteine-adding enzyme BshC